MSATYLQRAVADLSCTCDTMTRSRECRVHPDHGLQADPRCPECGDGTVVVTKDRQVLQCSSDCGWSEWAYSTDLNLTLLTEVS